MSHDAAAAGGRRHRLTDQQGDVTTAEKQTSCLPLPPLLVPGGSQEEQPTDSAISVGSVRFSQRHRINGECSLRRAEAARLSVIEAEDEMSPRSDADCVLFRIVATRRFSALNHACGTFLGINRGVRYFEKKLNT
ncbi:hypothetical protein ABVT39_001321 [Epinephelus coioides]